MSEQVHRPKFENQNNLDDVEVAFSKPQTTDIDSVLNEIDAVLEKNAEEFVKGFIQKGGQ
jgi:prokaryotic ubiquitin-like protein Pup